MYELWLVQRKDGGVNMKVKTGDKVVAVKSEPNRFNTIFKNPRNNETVELNTEKDCSGMEFEMEVIDFDDGTQFYFNKPDGSYLAFDDENVESKNQEIEVI